MDPPFSSLGRLLPTHKNEISFFASYRFPVHCAVMGGNVNLVKWLVEKEDCPLSVRRDSKSGMLCSIQTSARRTLVDLAMTGKPKIEILSYLIQKNLSALDTKDPKLAPKTLETLLGAGFRFEKREGDVESFQLVESSDHVSVATVDDAVSRFG